MGKLLLEDSDELLANLGGLVKGGKVVTLLVAGVTANGTDVDHAIAELDEGTTLDRDVEVGNVVQAEVGKLLVFVLANVLDEAVGGQLLAELEGLETVLGEAVVEKGGDRDACGLTELLLLLDEVGATDETDGAFLTELTEEGEDFGRGGLYSQEKKG